MKALRTSGTRLRHLLAAEWPILVTLLVPAACIWMFVALADEVIEGETRTIDSAILLALRNPADLANPLGPKWLEAMMRDFTALGGVGVLTLIIIGTESVSSSFTKGGQRLP